MKDWKVPVYVRMIGGRLELLKEFEVKAPTAKEAWVKVYDASRALGISPRNIQILTKDVQPA